MPPAAKRPCAGEVAWLSLGPRASAGHRVYAGSGSSRPPHRAPPEVRPVHAEA